MASVTLQPGRILLDAWRKVLAGEIGTLEAGNAADVALWDVARPAELAYWIGGGAAPTVLRGGVISQGNL